MWSAAWLGGVAATDDVLDALHVWGTEHEVLAADADTAATLGLPADGEPGAAPVRLLAALRALGVDRPWLVLPVAGDVRGLDGGGVFTTAALGAGEAVVLPGTGYGVVPRPIAEGLLRWTVYPLATEPAAEHVPLGEAEHGLTGAVRDSAGTLQALDVATDRPGVREELAKALRARPHPEWPSGMPGRSLRILHRADEVGAILDLAQADEPGGAVSASATTHRAEALRPLGAAVRRARCAAVNEAVRVLTTTPNPT